MTNSISSTVVEVTKNIHDTVMTANVKANLMNTPSSKVFQIHALKSVQKDLFDMHRIKYKLS